MNKNRDILFLCQYFYPEYVSSATLPADTAFALAKEGYSVSVLCGHPKEYSLEKSVPKQETVQSVSIKRLKYLQMGRSGFLGRLINYLSFTVAVFFQLLYFRHFRAIIVYSNPPILPIIAVWAKKLFNVKLIFVAYDLYPEIAETTQTVKAESAISTAMGYINSTLYPSCDAVVTLSEDMKDFIIKHRSIAADKVHVIPNWYEDVKTAQDNRPIEQNIFYEEYKDKFVASYLGNMGVCQDMDTILDAVRMLKDHETIRFLFAGHGSKITHIKEIIQTEGLTNARLHGFLHGQDYLDALAISSCGLVSLVEGMNDLSTPSKSYAYMMMGRPVVAVMHSNMSMSSDIPIIVNNADALYALLEALCRNPDSIINASAKNRLLYLEKFEKSRCLKSYSSLVHRLLAIDNGG